MQTDALAAVCSNGLFDYRDGYARMARHVAAHLDARVKAECECRVLRNLLLQVEFSAYQPAEVRDAINNLSSDKLTHGATP